MHLISELFGVRTRGHSSERMPLPSRRVPTGQQRVRYTGIALNRQTDSVKPKYSEIDKKRLNTGQKLVASYPIMAETAGTRYLNIG